MMNIRSGWRRRAEGERFFSDIKELRYKDPIDRCHEAGLRASASKSKSARMA